MPEGYHLRKDCPVIGFGKGECHKCVDNMPDPAFDQLATATAKVKEESGDKPVVRRRRNR